MENSVVGKLKEVVPCVKMAETDPVFTAWEASRFEQAVLSPEYGGMTVEEREKLSGIEPGAQSNEVFSIDIENIHRSISEESSARIDGDNNTLNAANQYTDSKISDIHFPTFPEPLIYNINEMFDFPSTSDFVAELHKSGVAGVRDLVVIRADDTSGITNDLVITPSFGFGSYYNKNVVHWGAAKDNEENYIATSSVIEITDEHEDEQCTIKIPAKCNSVDLSYFVGTRPAVKVSYWIDTNGTYHPFSLADTPIENFYNYQSAPSTSIIINGVSVLKNTIREIVFGDDYAGITSISHNFIANGFL